MVLFVLILQRMLLVFKFFTVVTMNLVAVKAFFLNTMSFKL